MSHHMHRIAVVAATAIVLLLPVTAARANSKPDTNRNPLTAAERTAGWVSLFNGRSTAAWRGYRKPGFPETGWLVEDELLRSIAEQNGGDLITKQLFENFELVLEYKAAKGANSGIIYRATEEYGASYQTGPEMQILDDEGRGVDRQAANSAGALYDLYAPSEEKVLHGAGEFNQVRIIMRNGVVQHWLNGVKIVEADLNSSDWEARVGASKFRNWEGFGTRPIGHIVLQHHGNDVWFRNIRIRDLDRPMPGEIDLFAGNRLDQWTAHLRKDGSMSDVWSFDGDVLVCAGRPIGYLRTNANYRNFVLKLQWRFDPEKGGGNSGVLLRMVGDDKVWPRSVEAQLQSGSAGDFWNIDKFVMRTEESRLNGRNTKRTHGHERPLGEWNDYEIIVHGPHITLKVNDEVVNEAWAVEELSGKLCLQSEGATIHFRNVRLAEIR